VSPFLPERNESLTDIMKENPVEKILDEIETLAQANIQYSRDRAIFKNIKNALQSSIYKNHNSKGLPNSLASNTLTFIQYKRQSPFSVSISQSNTPRQIVRINHLSKEVSANTNATNLVNLDKIVKPSNLANTLRDIIHEDHLNEAGSQEDNNKSVKKFDSSGQLSLFSRVLDDNNN
jgi:hypothetical protein